MSASAQWLPRSAGYRSTQCRSLLVQLPDDVIRMIFDRLAFEWMIQMSHTCRRLRSLAASQSTLWQALPAATVATLHTLEPFIPRSRALGFDLTIFDITIGQLSKLCKFLDSHFGKLRLLHLHFDRLPEGRAPDETTLSALHQTLAAQAPLLEDLSLDSDYCTAFLGSLRSDILGGAPAPKLRKLSLTAFTLAAACPGLQCVRTFVSTIGALSPRGLASENLDVHVLFPAVEHLELLEIEAERESNAAHGRLHRLVRVPVLTAPLACLRLVWRINAGAGPADDTRAANWLAASLPHVHQAHIRSPQCAPVSQAALSSNIAQACVLRITPHRAGNIELGLWSADPQRLRTAVLAELQARAQVENILQCAQYRLRLHTLTISTNPACLHFLWKDAPGPGSWDALTGLHTLNLVFDWNSFTRDGWPIAPETMERMQPLNNVRTLHVQPPAERPDTPRAAPRKINPLCFLELRGRVLPGVQKVILHLPDIQLYDMPNFAGCAFLYLSPHGCTTSNDTRSL